MPTIEERVKDVIAEMFDVDADRLEPDTSFSDDLDADDLSHMEFILALEDEFDITIPEDESEITTIAEAVACVEKRTK